MAIVYQHINMITKKSYIGWTSNSMEARWQQHVRQSIKKIINTKFQNALRKYGVDCWEHKILFECKSNSDAKIKEIEMIDLYDTYNTGYNSTKGGDGNNCIRMSAESNLKRSLSAKGKSKTYNRMLGKTHSPETKEKISQAHKNKKKPWVKWSPEQIRTRSLKRRSLTEYQFIMIKQLKEQNLSLKEISKQLNVSYDVVKKWHTIETW
jgi:group I intron endonuclease